MTTTPFQKISGFMPKKTNDDFGAGPTMVEPEPQFAEGTPPPVQVVPKPVAVVVAPPKVAPQQPSNVVPFMQPRTMAAIAGANPQAIEMRNVSPNPSKVNPATTLPDGVVGVAVRNQLLAAGVATPAKAAPQPAVPAPQIAPQPTVIPATPPKVIVEGLPSKQSFTPATTVLGMTPVSAKVKPRTGDAPLHLDASASFDKIDMAKTTAFRKEDVEEAAKQLGHATNDNAQWRQFEKIGLKPKAAPSNAIGKLVVNVYRLLGFGILTVIVVVLVSYIATTAFYMVNKSWITPVAVSPNDEKVVATQTQLTAAQNQRDRVAAELADADRSILAQQAFQVEFAKAIASDLEGRKAALSRTLALAGQAGSMRHQIHVANDDYAKAHEDKMKKEYETGLIDRNSMLAGKFQIAQISTTNLSLAERQAQFETQAAELATQTRSLDALLAKRDKSSPALSYDVLKIKHDFDQSKLELAKAIEARDMLKSNLARQDKIIEELQGSGYLHAVADKATVALVPYSNLDKVSPGTAVYACRLEMVWCREVGSVLKTLPGEVQFKHPHRDKQVRGQMIELRMDDLGAAEDEVLFVDGKPLGF